MSLVLALEATVTVTANPKIANCTSCGEPFDASAPVGGSQALLAQCGWCERRYYISVLDQPSPDIILSNEVIDGFTPSQHLSVQDATTMQKLLVSLPGTAVEKDDRRQFARVRAALRLVVAPLDSELLPIASALDAASIDISISGISFVVKSNPDADFWMIDFGPTAEVGTQAVMKVARKEPLGEGCWKVAGPFTIELDKAAASS